jgi:hypothetical protein
MTRCAAAMWGVVRAAAASELASFPLMVLCAGPDAFHAALEGTPPGLGASMTLSADAFVQILS